MTISFNSQSIKCSEATRLSEITTAERDKLRESTQQLQSKMDNERKRRVDAELALVPLKSKSVELETNLADCQLEMVALEAQKQRLETSVSLLNDRNASLEANQVRFFFFVDSQ
jgi:chromosome segregation ATPase